MQIYEIKHFYLLQTSLGLSNFKNNILVIINRWKNTKCAKYLESISNHLDQLHFTIYWWLFWQKVMNIAITNFEMTLFWKKNISISLP